MNIIAVDDERGALSVLTQAIREAVPEARVLPFQNPEEALAYAKSNPCSVAFLDIEMRSMSGVVLAQTLKSHDPKLNIVFVTGYSHYTGEAVALRVSGYVYKPATAAKIREEMENLRYPVPDEREGIFARTFGNFDLLVDGKSVPFGRSKAKELLAYLIDRRGASVTRRELTAVLFEDEAYTRATQDYMSKVVTDLCRSLQAVGAGHILAREKNSYAVDPRQFSCDLYEYESLNPTPEALNRFKGEYMSQYSWGEATQARLYWKK